jgi:LPXTG-site transpeptidase (sortase) family protein
MKSTLFYLERTLLLGGLSLIIVFLAVKIHAQQGHSSSVGQVEALIASHEKTLGLSKKSDTGLVLANENTRIISDDANNNKSAEPIISKQSPDMSDWSANRKKHYHEAEVSSTALGLLEIPQIDLKVAIFDQASEPHLNKGVARVLQSAKLSGEGNLSIAGHRDGFFRKLGSLVLGDIFTVKDLQGNKFHYQITKTFIVEPKDTYVMKATEKPSITLITCYPFYFAGSAPERYIVRAERI